MTPQALEVFDAALDCIDEEIHRPSLKVFRYYSDTRHAYRKVGVALEHSRNVIRKIKADQFSFTLGANSPFTHYVRDNIDDFNIPEPKNCRWKHNNGIRFFRPAYLDAATAAVQYTLNKLAIARCFKAAAMYPAAVAVVRIQFDNGWQGRDAPIQDAFNLIDDAISCAELDNFLRASVRVFDDRDLFDVIRIVGNDQSYFARTLDEVSDAVIKQCRANILKIWFED